MIFVGIDDTDTLDSPGTNQMARAIVAALADRYECRFVLRHQLFFDPRVPYTSKNGSASIELHPRTDAPSLSEVLSTARAVMRDRFVEGSDPGLCVTSLVPAEITVFGRDCQRRIVDQREARGLAERTSIALEGLGGTEGGVIGALAAVGLAACRDDGRVVVHGLHAEMTGEQPVAMIASRQIRVQEFSTGEVVTTGALVFEKKLRPNIRAGQVVLFVERDSTSNGIRWRPLKQN